MLMYWLCLAFRTLPIISTSQSQIAAKRIQPMLALACIGGGDEVRVAFEKHYQCKELTLKEHRIVDGCIRGGNTIQTAWARWKADEKLSSEQQRIVDAGLESGEAVQTAWAKWKADEKLSSTQKRIVDAKQIKAVAVAASRGYDTKIYSWRCMRKVSNEDGKLVYCNGTTKGMTHQMGRCPSCKAQNKFLSDLWQAVGVTDQPQGNIRHFRCINNPGQGVSIAIGLQIRCCDSSRHAGSSSHLVQVASPVCPSEAPWTKKVSPLCSFVHTYN